MAKYMHPYRMSWSFQIGRIFGIDIRVHYVFVAFVALLCLQETLQSGSIEYGAHLLFKILLLFGFVLLHELGHSLMAQRAGIRVIDIVLWPLGGLARLQGQSNDPMTEFK
ncbi:MAG: site-2 protease family protein, partial [Planctomycetota bacterium]